MNNCEGCGCPVEPNGFSLDLSLLTKQGTRTWRRFCNWSCMEDYIEKYGDRLIEDTPKSGLLGRFIQSLGGF